VLQCFNKAFLKIEKYFFGLPGFLSMKDQFWWVGQIIQLTQEFLMMVLYLSAYIYQYI